MPYWQAYEDIPGDPPQENAVGVVFYTKSCDIRLIHVPMGEVPEELLNENDRAHRFPPEIDRAGPDMDAEIFGGDIMTEEEPRSYARSPFNGHWWTGE